MRAILFTSLFIALTIQLTAQNTAGQKVLMAPKNYNSPTGVVEGVDCERLSATSANNVWIVFSDRGNNPTYTTSAASLPWKKMNYMDAFYVIGEQGDYLHLVKYEVDASLFDKNYKLTRGLEDYGWAPKAKLLLWGNSLVDPRTKFTIKALSINSVQNLNKIADYAKGNSLKIFNDPELTEKNGNDVRLFDFLYVFKRTDKAVLIGVTDRLNRISAKFAGRKIYGWVANTVINEWSDRITLEPNWDEAAVEERKSKGVKASIFSTQEAAEAYKNSGSGEAKKVLWDNDKLTAARKMPEWKRLPFLGPGPIPGTFKTGAVTSVFNEYNQEVIKEDEQTLIEKAYGELRKSRRNVNIVFVVDGSEVMSDYYAPVLSTIMKTANELDKASGVGDEDEASANKYKMGLVVYRDYTDNNCMPGIDDFQEKTLTTNFRDVAEYLQNDVKFGSCKKGGSPRRAMYAGIMKALKQFQETKNQTNIIVLIGAGSNRPDDAKVNTEELVNLLAEYRVGFLGFQAKHPMDASYEDFPIQVLDLLQNASQKVQQKLTKDFPGRKSTTAMLEDKGNNVYKFDCPRKAPVPGGVMISDQLNPINPAELYGQVQLLLTELTQSIEEILAGMDSKLKGQGVRTDMNEGMYAFLSQMNVNIDLLRNSSYENIQLFVEGYTARTCDKLQHPVYKHCLFLSYAELSDLMRDLQSIQQSSTSKSEDRKRMQNAFYSLLAARLGPKEAKKKMSSLTPAQLLALITGLDSKNTLLQKFKLDEITKEKVVSDQEIDAIRIDIGNKLEELEKYKAGAGNSFMSNDQNYYWLPEDLLP